MKKFFNYRRLSTANVETMQSSLFQSNHTTITERGMQRAPIGWGWEYRQCIVPDPGHRIFIRNIPDVRSIKLITNLSISFITSSYNNQVHKCHPITRHYSVRNRMYCSVWDNAHGLPRLSKIHPTNGNRLSYTIYPQSNFFIKCCTVFIRWHLLLVDVMKFSFL